MGVWSLKEGGRGGKGGLDGVVVVVVVVMAAAMIKTAKKRRGKYPAGMNGIGTANGWIDGSRVVCMCNCYFLYRTERTYSIPRNTNCICKKVGCLASL